MSALSKTSAPNHLASRKPVDSRELTMDEVVPYLVGHTVEEVERRVAAALTSLVVNYVQHIENWVGCSVSVDSVEKVPTGVGLLILWHAKMYLPCKGVAGNLEFFIADKHGLFGNCAAS